MPRDQILPAARYDSTARGFHWLTAAIVLGMIGVGLWMVDLPISRQKLVVYGWHKWFGLTVMVLTVARLAWRWFHPPPPLPHVITAWEQRAAPIAHWTLYGLLLAMPITGWLMTSAAGMPVIWFGLFQVPDLVDRDPALFELFKAAHHWLSRLLIVVLLIHVAAVIRHDVLRRDGILRRMLPFVR